jgi:proteasome lid subunit RPN8/RPN11
VVEVDAMNIIVPTAIIESTLGSLREAGKRDSEAVLLWLGRTTPNGINIVEAYMPEQEAAHDYFHIPRRAMSALLRHLGETKTLIGAQIHSHPEKAFHSSADDRWAIIRHEGALSLVVPYFAEHTFAINFLDQIAAFKLSTSNVWQELQDEDRRSAIRLI